MHPSATHSADSPTLSQEAMIEKLLPQRGAISSSDLGRCVDCKITDIHALLVSKLVNYSSDCCRATLCRYMPLKFSTLGKGVELPDEFLLDTNLNTYCSFAVVRIVEDILVASFRLKEDFLWRVSAVYVTVKGHLTRGVPRIGESILRHSTIRRSFPSANLLLVPAPWRIDVTGSCSIVDAWLRAAALVSLRRGVRVRLAGAVRISGVVVLASPVIKPDRIWIIDGPTHLTPSSTPVLRDPLLRDRVPAHLPVAPAARLIERRAGPRVNRLTLHRSLSTRPLDICRSPLRDALRLGLAY